MPLKKLFFTLLLTCSFSFLFGQRERATRDYYQRMHQQVWAAIESYDSLLFGMKPVSIDPEPISFQRTEDSTFYNQIDTSVYLSTRVLRSQTGLELTAGYTYSTTVGESFFPDIEDDWGYRDKFQATLSWNLMQSALIGSKPKKEVIRLEGEIEKINLASQQNRNLYQEALNEIDAKYNGYILRVLKERERLLGELQFIYEEMYRHSDALIDDLYDINFQKKMIAHTLSLQPNANIANSLFHKDLFIYYNVDADKFTELTLNNNDQVKINEKRIEIAEQKNNLNRYVYDMRVVPFTRYQYLIYPTGHRDVSNFQAGVNVTIPLSRSARMSRLSEEKKIVIAEQNLEMLSQQASRKAGEALIKTGKLANRLQSALHELTNFGMEFRLLKFRSNANPYSINGLKALQSMDRYLELLMNLYLNRIEYEKQLLDIKLLAGDADFSEFSSPEYMDGDMSLNLKPKSVYLWSAYHSKKPIPETVSLIWKNNINTVYIGYNSNLPQTHYLDLIAEFNRYKIKPLLCIANNDLVLQSKEEIRNYFERLNGIPAAGIHLNVEPHQLSSWADNREAHLKGLLLTIETAREWCNERSYELSASVPHTYTSDFYLEAFKHLDMLTLMLYNKDVPTIVNLLMSLPYLSNNETPVEVALRPEDFIPDFLTESDKLLANPLVNGLAIESFRTLLYMNLYNPDIRKTGNTFELVFDSYMDDDEVEKIEKKLANTNAKLEVYSTPGEAKKIKLTNLKTRREAISFFGNIIKD